MYKKPDNRISPLDARAFARDVHTDKEPKFLRQYNSRTEAGTRRWEFSNSRQAFQGLGLDFFVAAAPDGDEVSGPWGVWARPHKDADKVITYLKDGTPCLILYPDIVAEELFPLAVQETPEPKPARSTRRAVTTPKASVQ